MVKGLRARGGFEVGVAWADGQLASAELKSIGGGPCKVRYSQKTVDLILKPGKTATWNGR